MKKKIIISGGSGTFAKHFKNFNKKFNIKFPGKYKFNILKPTQMDKYIKKFKPDYLIHNAALSRPMELHDQNISLSIKKNIIGTCNVVNVCHKNNVKLIYFSTNYVYQGNKGNYKESDAVLPFNKYGWSKLGGECAVHLYENSLIFRLSITQKPFKYKKAFSNIFSSFIYYDQAAKIVMKLINKKGIINIGGKKNSIYNFVKKNNNKVKPIKIKINENKNLPKDSSMNVNKILKILNNI